MLDIRNEALIGFALKCDKNKYNNALGCNSRQQLMQRLFMLESTTHIIKRIV